MIRLRHVTRSWIRTVPQALRLLPLHFNTLVWVWHKVVPNSVRVFINSVPFVGDYQGISSVSDFLGHVANASGTLCYVSLRNGGI